MVCVEAALLDEHRARRHGDLPSCLDHGIHRLVGQVDNLGQVEVGLDGTFDQLSLGGVLRCVAFTALCAATAAHSLAAREVQLLPQPEGVEVLPRDLVRVKDAPFGGDRRAARLVEEQRHLPEDFAAPQRSDLLAPDAHEGSSALDHEEVVALPSLRDDGGPGLEGDVVADLREFGALRQGKLLEEFQLRQERQLLPLVVSAPEPGTLSRSAPAALRARWALWALWARRLDGGTPYGVTPFRLAVTPLRLAHFGCARCAHLQGAADRPIGPKLGTGARNSQTSPSQALELLPTA